MSMHTRMFIGILVIAAATLPARCASAGPGADGWLGGTGARRLPRAQDARVSVDARPAAATSRCHAHARRLRAARQRRYRHGRRAPDDRRAETGMGQHPDAGGPARARRAARRAPNRARRRQPATCAGLATRPLDARPRDRRADRSRERHRVDDAARLRVGALRGDADRAAHRHGPDRSAAASSRSRPRPTPRTAGRCTDRRAGRSSSPGNARSTIGDRRCRFARKHESPSSSRSARMRRRSR